MLKTSQKIKKSKKQFYLLVFLLFCFLAFLFFSQPSLVFAQESPLVYLTIFWGHSCPHCEKELKFLDKLEKEFPNLEVRKLEVWNNRDNANLMKQVGQKLNAQVSSVPFTVIGEETISGYLNDETTGARIKAIVQRHSTNGCFDTVGEIIGEKPTEEEKQCANGLVETITLPFFGEVNTKTWSLPLLTIVIAAIDGFNPCAMWVLLFLISLLLGMQDRRKMWILGSSFIIASALVYFLFLAAWLEIFLFLGFIRAIRIIIGLVAIGSGGYHLRSWWKNRDGTCEVTNEERQEKIMNKFRQVAEQKTFWLALVGIVSVAAAVNLIELVCSAGLPAIYTQILSLANLPRIYYYLYLLLYIFIFLLDDLIVFIVAMVTLQAFSLGAKYGRWSNLIGGIIILILGILLIFKPGWIMFG